MKRNGRELGGKPGEMSMTPKEERALREEWSPGCTIAEKFNKMRSGHTVISGLGVLNKICFGGVIRPDWIGLRSE